MALAALAMKEAQMAKAMEKRVGVVGMCSGAGAEMEIGGT